MDFGGERQEITSAFCPWCDFEETHAGHKVAFKMKRYDIYDISSFLRSRT